MRFIGRGLLGLMLLTLTLGILIVAGSSIFRTLEDRRAASDRPSFARERVFSVNVEAVELKSITPVITTFGEIASGRTLDIRAAASGAIQNLSPNFRNGGQVQEGEILFQTDPAAALTQEQLARADLQDATAELSQAREALLLAEDELTAANEQVRLREQALTRQASLQDRGVSTAGALEAAELALSSAKQMVLGKRAAFANAKSRIEAAKVAVARRQINLDEAERKLADTTVTARFTGVLSDVSVVEGGLVTANERLGQLIDPTALEVIFRLSNTEFARLSETGALNDRRVFVAPTQTTSPVPARIERVNAAVGDGQTGREIFAILQDVTTLRPGDFVTVRLEEPELQNVALIPTQAANAQGQVLVMGSEDRLEQVTTEILRKQGDFLIVSGPLEGREVILQRAPQLGEGIKVKPLRTGAPPPATDMEISDDLRAKLIAYVQANTRIPENRKAGILEKLNQPKVPIAMVERLQSRMGG